ncbi:MAG TPA: hypothetical protein VHA73_15780 [Acidimicrobiales bacterium]|nr:hypothetical protein [Acidimicrobiales bacterium]
MVLAALRIVPFSTLDSFKPLVYVASSRARATWWRLVMVITVRGHPLGRTLRAARGLGWPISFVRKLEPSVPHRCRQRALGKRVAMVGLGIRGRRRVDGHVADDAGQRLE